MAIPIGSNRRPGHDEVLLRVHDLELRRPGSRGASPLLRVGALDVFAGDRLGLVGRSGSGKSTLLSVLAGTAQAGEGAVVRPPGVRVAYLRQGVDGVPSTTVADVAAAALSEVRAAEERVRAAERRLASGGQDASHDHAAALEEHERLGGYRAESELRELLHALGFPETSWGRETEALSTGQRRRLALAATLATPADVLLLDEPTNHLDMPARAWLERHLVDGGRTVIIVSHDRALLTAATTETLFIESGRLRRVAGGYDRAAKRVETESASHLRRAREARREATRLERVARELAREGRRTKARERAARDLGRHAAGLVEGTGSEPAVTFDTGPDETDRGVRRRGWLLHAEGLSRDGLYEDVTVRLGPGDRIALVGANGSGKSSLLAQLAGVLPLGGPLARLEYAPGMRLAYVGQVDRGLVDGIPVLEQLAAPLGDERARSNLAEAGLPYTSWSLPPERLSGGERAKAGLAMALALGPDLLVLDEPDNDLDLAGVEALEEALSRVAEAGVALLVATHDRSLARRALGRAWQLRDGDLVAYPSVRAYLRGEKHVAADTFWREAAELPEPPSVVAGTATEEDPVARLEEERVALLEVLGDPVGMTPRDRARARRRLSEVEGELVTLLDARLEPPRPRYKLREGGYDVFADATATGTWRLVIAVGPEEAAVELGGSGKRLPSATLRAIGEVGHLATEEPEGSRYLPVVTSALLDAGTRLAFTVAGVSAVQAHVDGVASPTLLSQSAGGWWFSDLGAFLGSQGWRPGHETGGPR